MVINEFGQGRGGNGEWVELLVVGTGPCSTVDMRGWKLRDLQGNAAGGVWVVFASHPFWQAVVPGTIVVIYNAGDTGNLPLHFPPHPDTDPSDFLLVLPHNHATYFASGGRWEGLGNAGDWVQLLDAGDRLVDGISYGDRMGQSPHLSAVGARRAAAYTRSGTAGTSVAANWVVGFEVSGEGTPLSTPGAGNTSENAAWILGLRPRPAISVSPSSYDFGTVAVGQESAPLPVTVQNTGCAPLVVGAVTLTGANAAEFLIRNDNVSGQTIPVGESRTVQAVFKPASPGAKTATLEIPSNDPETPLATVALFGTGQAALSVSAGGPYSGVVGVPVTLEATATGGVPPYTFAWDLDGDGEYDDATGAQVHRTWPAPGTFPVAVQVRDSTGATATNATTVRIYPAKGDVNGDGRIDLVDLRLAHQAALGLIQLSPEERARADINGNGVVDQEDVELLCRMILGGCA